MASESDLTGLMKFAEREEWQECFSVVMETHFGAILDVGDIDFEDLIEMVGEQWQGPLWGCAFEDFLSLDFDVPGKNIVDEYLKRRSWREKPPAKAYMKALRNALMSLYEVSDVIPGESMKLRDLLRGGEPVTVSERSATQSLQQWDRIAARVVQVRGKTIISGGLLPFSFEACEMLFDGVKELPNVENYESLQDGQLKDLAPAFTMTWLADMASKAEFRENPVLFNIEEELIEFHDVRFPFASGVTQKQIASRLNAVVEFEQAGSKIWNWLELSPDGASNKTSGRAQGMSLDSLTDGGIRVLGGLELKGKKLLLSVNSAGRAERGRAMIEEALGELVRRPLTEIRSLKQLMDEDTCQSEMGSEDDIPPEIAEQIMQQTLDKHYLETLDQPIPALGNDTPRRAAKTKVGQKKVIEWLKYLEHSTHSQPNSPNLKYDFAWMWEELGIKRPNT